MRCRPVAVTFMYLLFQATLIIQTEHYKILLLCLNRKVAVY